MIGDFEGKTGILQESNFFGSTTALTVENGNTTTVPSAGASFRPRLMISMRDIQQQTTPTGFARTATKTSKKSSTGRLHRWSRIQILILVTATNSMTCATHLNGAKQASRYSPALPRWGGVFTYHSERPNTRSTHIQCCPGQPRAFRR